MFCAADVNRVWERGKVCSVSSGNFAEVRTHGILTEWKDTYIIKGIFCIFVQLHSIQNNVACGRAVMKKCHILIIVISDEIQRRYWVRFTMKLSELSGWSLQEIEVANVSFSCAGQFSTDKPQSENPSRDGH